MVKLTSEHEARNGKRVKMDHQEIMSQAEKTRSRMSVNNLLRDPTPPAESVRSSYRPSFEPDTQGQLGASVTLPTTPLDTGYPVYPAKSAPVNSSPSEPQTPKADGTPSLSAKSRPPASAEDSSALASRRHVSGPGQFTPRALLKSEGEFEQVGVNIGHLLGLKGDQIAWWLAEQIIWLRNYLESPQKGAPSSLNARPHGRLRSIGGDDINHCCPKGGIDHLKPCNMPIYPSSAEAFPFAAQLRENFLPKHHASKGGVNTIAFVGDLVLEKLAGISRIDEEEFKLIAGSEHIRQFFGRGYRRYKSSEPNVDPTKQPILALKSLKKLSQNRELVTNLKTRYAWALTHKQSLVGAQLPHLQTSHLDGVKIAAVGIGPATTPKTPYIPPPPRRERKNQATLVQRRPIETPRKEVSDESPHDARLSRRPEFPLRGMTETENTQAARLIVKICDLLEDFFSLSQSGGQQYRNGDSRTKSRIILPKKRSAPKSRKRGSTDEVADLLLSLANGGRPLGSDDDMSDDDSAIADDLLSAPFELYPETRIDPCLRGLIELAVNTRIKERSGALNDTNKTATNIQLGKIRKCFDQIDLRCNAVISNGQSVALIRLVRILAEQVK